MKFWLVYVTVWIAVGCWFLGTGLRILAKGPSTPFSRVSVLAGLVGLIGAVLMVIHTLASYGFVHEWSHRTALRFTGDQSETVMGVRVESGLYANFLFIAAWVLVAFESLGRVRIPSPWVWGIHAFSILIVFCATIVFEAGWIRYAACGGFLALASLAIGQSKLIPNGDTR